MFSEPENNHVEAYPTSTTAIAATIHTCPTTRRNLPTSAPRFRTRHRA
jgi:hypothetical protein